MQHLAGCRCRHHSLRRWRAPRHRRSQAQRLVQASVSSSLPSSQSLARLRALVAAGRRLAVDAVIGRVEVPVIAAFAWSHDPIAATRRLAVLRQASVSMSLPSSQASKRRSSWARSARVMPSPQRATTQRFRQASSSALLPSSQASKSSSPSARSRRKMPSPQRASMHPAVQPSSSTRLPSSQAS